MKIALVQCPAWVTGNPPYALALLSAVLERAGHEVECLDLNIEMYRISAAQGAGKADEMGPDSWANRLIERRWIDPGKVAGFIRRYDRQIECFIDSFLARSSARVIGFSVHVTSRLFSLEVARRIKEKDRARIVLFGGPACFKNYDKENILETYPFVDAVCYGAAEASVAALIDEIEERGYASAGRPGYGVRTPDGRVVEGSGRPPLPDLDALPWADYARFDLARYTGERWLPVMASRGCIRRCRFCTENVHWGSYRSRSPARVVEEIQYQIERHRPFFRYVWFTDPIFNGNIPALHELCELLIERSLGIEWTAMVAIRKEMTMELLRKMKRAGCHMLHIGLESGSDKVLALMGKGYTSALAKEVVKRIHRAGIRFNTNIIVGYPGESVYNFLETVKMVSWLKRFKIAPAPAVLGIHPGSYLYDHMDSIGVFFPASGGDWRSRDGSNTPEIRRARQETLERILGVKSLLRPVRVAREYAIASRFALGEALRVLRHSVPRHRGPRRSGDDALQRHERPSSGRVG